MPRNRTVPTSIVFYRGPSMIDGAPIVAIATGGKGKGSQNDKTGVMIQTFIMRADMDPIAASKAGADASVCGGCALRHALGGECYVNIGQAPLGAWGAWSRGRVPVFSLAEYARHKGRQVRMGSYGDPAAVPPEAWAGIEEYSPKGHTGYTHQWRTAPDVWKGLVMASCDNAAEQAEAAAMGWRTFTTWADGEAKPAGIECPADSRGIQCETCLLCSGTRRKAANVWIRVHGSWKSRRAKRALSPSPFID